MLKLSGIEKFFGSRALLQGIDFHFTSGRKYALYGPNGSGKSTLLGIMIGSLSPDRGQVILPKNCKIGFLPQEANPHPAATILAEVEAAHGALADLGKRLAEALATLEVRHDPEAVLAYETAELRFRQAGGYELPAKARMLLSGLGFGPDSFERSPLSLSGGWRMRVELARMLIQDPDILVLDEPTNHLDLPSLMWFETWLKSFAGTLIFVSHDRSLLNYLPDTLVHLRGGRLYAYSGNYDSFCRQRLLESEQAEARHENLERKKKQLERFVERFGATASKASLAGSKKKVIARLADEQSSIELPSHARQMAIALREPPRNGRVVCELRNLRIGYREALSGSVNAVIENGQKIGIVGANGRGKSTLLKTLAGLLPPLSGSLMFSQASRLGYFAQDQRDTFRNDRSVLANLMDSLGLPERVCRQALGAFMFSGEDVFKDFGVLSGGEKSRVGLCALFNAPHNVLMLDEPTNHLDLASIEALVGAIQAYQGTLLLVSHDRALIEAACDRLIVFRNDGAIELREGAAERWDEVF